MVLDFTFFISITSLKKWYKISSTSASDALDFLRLAFNWLYRSAASSHSLALADFCFRLESCDYTSTSSCLNDSFSLAELPNSICNRWFSARTVSISGKTSLFGWCVILATSVSIGFCHFHKRRNFRAYRFYKLRGLNIYRFYKRITTEC